jgi:hypothetical protein
MKRFDNRRHPLVARNEKCLGIIKTHPKVTVTIDTFQWDFLWEQPKQHFIIRIKK